MPKEALQELLRRESKLHADFEPDVVAFECVLGADLGQPLHFASKADLAELHSIREHRPMRHRRDGKRFVVRADEELTAWTRGIGSTSYRVGTTKVLLTEARGVWRSRGNQSL